MIKPRILYIHGFNRKKKVHKNNFKTVVYWSETIIFWLGTVTIYTTMYVRLHIFIHSAMYQNWYLMTNVTIWRAIGLYLTNKRSKLIHMWRWQVSWANSIVLNLENGSRIRQSLKTTFLSFFFFFFFFSYRDFTSFEFLTYVPFFFWP